MKIPLKLIGSCALLLFFVNSAFANNPDLAYKKKIAFEIHKTNDGSYGLTSAVEVKQTFLSKRSTYWNWVNISEPFWAKVSKLKATFRDKGLKKRIYHTTRLVEFKDIFVSDHKIHTLLFPGDIRQGDTATFCYKQEYAEVAFLPIISVPNIDSVESYHIVFKHPKTTRIDFEIFFSRDSIDFEIDKSNARQTTLFFNHIGYKKKLDYYPFNDFHAAILASITDKGKPVNPVKPKEMLDWYASQVDLNPTIADGWKDLLDKELSGLRSPLEKVKVIYEYVQKNIRYIADERALNAYQPQDPSFTLEKGYGDCKDKAYLISALAQRYNIKVDMAIVATKPAPPFKGIHLNVFNHVICAYDLGSKIIYFDPTSQFCEFGNLPECDNEAQAFILNQKAPRGIIIPAPNHIPSIEIKITGNASHHENGSALIVLRNDCFHNAIHAKAVLNGVKLENVLSQMIASHIYKIALEDFIFIKKDSDSITFSAKADLSDFLISSAASIYIPKTPFLAINKDILIRQDDNFPLYLQSRNNFLMTMDIDVTGYESSGSSFKLGEEKGAYFSSSITHTEPNRISIKYDYRQPVKRFDGVEKRCFIDFCAKYLRAKKDMFILKGTK